MHLGENEFSYMYFCGFDGLSGLSASKEESKRDEKGDENSILLGQRSGEQAEAEAEAEAERRVYAEAEAEAERGVEAEADGSSKKGESTGSGVGDGKGQERTRRERGYWNGCEDARSGKQCRWVCFVFFGVMSLR